MWIRQCDLDQSEGTSYPIPARISSNEEFVPPRQSLQQKQYEALLNEIAEKSARRQGIDRRSFFRTGCGMAAALFALNRVFGRYYDVRADEIDDPMAFEERWPKEQFVFDVQTHHVDVSRKWYDDTPAGRGITDFFRMLRPSESTQQSLDQLNRTHYVKEIFGDSDTVMAIISGVPSREWNKNPLPPDQMAATRDYVNSLAGTTRVLSHGLLRPNLGKSELEELERQVKELGISAWKMYTGAELGEAPWFMDDREVAYPCWERTKELGVKHLCVHKGLPLGAFNEKACQPFDLKQAALDWPDLNFIVYHSAFRGFGWIAKGTGEQVQDKSSNDPQEIPWTSDLIRILRDNPTIKNVYFELGSTFNMTSMYSPEMCLHMLGQMIEVAGPDRILWGTDSIWNGSPQSQIERFRRLIMPDELRDKFGYPELTDEIKAKILGLNAAKLFGIDHRAQLKAIKADRLSQVRQEFRKNAQPSNTQFGWVWREDGDLPTIPVGQGDAPHDS